MGLRCWPYPKSEIRKFNIIFNHFVPPVGLDPPSRVKFLTVPFFMCFYSIMMRKDLTALEQILALVIVITVSLKCLLVSLFKGARF